MKKSILIAVVGIMIGLIIGKIWFVDHRSSQLVQSTQISGTVTDLFPKNIRKDNDTYYITFARQMQDKKLAPSCYLEDGSVIDSSECILEGRPLEQKKVPDIDLSQEYTFDMGAHVLLLSYDERMTSILGRLPIKDAVPIEEFYGYLRNPDLAKIEYYGGVTEQIQNWGFDVVMVNGKIKQMEQVYQE